MDFNSARLLRENDFVQCGRFDFVEELWGTKWGKEEEENVKVGDMPKQLTKE